MAKSTHVIWWICKSVCAPRVSESFPVDPIDCANNKKPPRRQETREEEKMSTNQVIHVTADVFLINACKNRKKTYLVAQTTKKNKTRNERMVWFRVWVRLCAKGQNRRDAS